MVPRTFAAWRRTDASRDARSGITEAESEKKFTRTITLSAASCTDVSASWSAIEMAGRPVDALMRATPRTAAARTAAEGSPWMAAARSSTPFGSMNSPIAAAARSRCTSVSPRFASTVVMSCMMASKPSGRRRSHHAASSRTVGSESSRMRRSSSGTQAVHSTRSPYSSIDAICEGAA